MIKLPDGVDDILEHDVGAHGLPVRDDRFKVHLGVAVPAVQLHTPGNTRFQPKLLAKNPRFSTQTTGG